MSIFIRRLELVDENDIVIYRCRNKRANKEMPNIISIIEEKDGGGYWRKLDNDFKKLFKDGIK